MNENIDLTKILKDCPKGTKLYSPIIGNVCLEEIIKEGNHSHPIRMIGKNDVHEVFTREGKYYDTEEAECVLFPSKENRDWDKFEVNILNSEKHKGFKPFDKVLVVEYEIDRKAWMAVYYSHWSNNLGVHITTTGGHYEDKEIIPYEGNENKVGEEVEE